MIPWKWVNLTPRDQSGTLIRVWNKSAPQVAGGIVGTAQWQVPSDQAALLLNWSAVGQGVAGTLPLEAILTISTDAAVTFTSFFSQGSFPTSLGNQTSAAGLRGSINVLLGGVLAAPGSFVTIQVAYTAPGATTSSMAIGAVIIPRGDAAYL